MSPDEQWVLVCDERRATLFRCRRRKQRWDLTLQNTVDNPWESYPQRPIDRQQRRFAHMVAVLVRRQETAWHDTRLHIFAPARFMAELQPDLEARPELGMRRRHGALHLYTEELTRLRLWELETHPDVLAALDYCDLGSVKMQS